MAYDFLDRLSTPSVRAARIANGADGLWEKLEGDRSSGRFTEREAAFIGLRDSFYLASLSATGWPYIQHRGGPPGFLRVLDDTTLGFADFRGNRQYLSLGNVADDDRVALFLMDYPARRRLKVLAHMAPRDLRADPDLAARLATPGYRGVAERGFTLRLEAFDWNCPQHITPRFTAAEVEDATAALRERLAILEAENARLRDAATPQASRDGRS
ncbi:MAG: Flavodoxin reductases (ferredoxin-NADPH reductases) family 1 [uncultured Sphingomonadaceae bacterium]|uniref:Flavodoxin reductases (Ferredoxin-NADPH reductases) family 1 n=1 Tax=uncultured Sphingomonadaceae bacterium TaxID=169976 RepID=A0A6J4SVA2_9SPHN|nr:MAG: Flavodoxin reductases (ferredoxin-NADPH reductases) family 1 [uncultured Sphingomonadaceae bacterium]